MVSPRGLVKTLRTKLHSIPVLGHGVRYLKRLVILPWNFHKLLAAWSDDPPATAARAAAWDASGSTKEAVYIAANQTTQNVVKTVVTWGEWNANAINNLTGSLKRELTQSVTIVSSDMASEIQKLNDTHAMCYDRLAATLREMLQHQQATDSAKSQMEVLTRTIQELTVQVETLTEQVATLKADAAQPTAKESTNGKGTLHLLRNVG